MNSRKRKRNNAQSSETNGKRQDNVEKSNTDSESVSKYFSEPSSKVSLNISDCLINIAVELNDGLKDLKFSDPVKYIYNPTIYAFEPFKNYIEKYGNSEKVVLFLGMNPGPFGMSQTGVRSLNIHKLVPFGEINAVKDWLKIQGEVKKPPVESPQRPVLGFDCKRSEVSGKRFWALAKTLCDTPENFFKNCFVYNYCPLQFIKSVNGGNVTPTELKIQERDALYKLCNGSLLETVKILNCKIVVGIGSFAEKQLQKIFSGNESIEIVSIPHPSPRAANNMDWQNKTIKHMETLDLLRYFNK